MAEMIRPATVAIPRTMLSQKTFLPRELLAVVAASIALDVLSIDSIKEVALRSNNLIMIRSRYGAPRSSNPRAFSKDSLLVSLEYSVMAPPFRGLIYSIHNAEITRRLSGRLDKLVIRRFIMFFKGDPFEKDKRALLLVALLAFIGFCIFGGLPIYFYLIKP